MTRKYLENAGDAEASKPVLPASTYDVEVIDAHPNPKTNKGIFIDMKVLNGPYIGQVAGVYLTVPDDGDKGEFYFHNKVAGFAADIRAVDWSQVSDDDEVQVLADTLIGKMVAATLTISDRKGYEGKQELDSTKPLDGTGATAVATPTAAAAVPAAAVPAQAAPAATPAVAVQPVAAAAAVPQEAAQPVSVGAAASTDDVPF